jgi:hypothetical protein
MILSLFVFIAASIAGRTDHEHAKLNILTKGNPLSGVAALPQEESVDSHEGAESGSRNSEFGSLAISGFIKS